jgi:superoxide dismutase, Fe-Mn family
MKPLPFDPTKLRGISERMIVSHHENNYGGAVKNLARVEAELARVTSDTPPFVVAALKERELTFSNSAILHEHYFGNLGGDGKPSSPIQSALATAFGSMARWEELFRATALGLAGGSGWVILTYDFRSSSPRIVWSGHHTQSLAFGRSLLVLDMYEHSYAIDYGAAAAKYVDAFFDNIQWDAVSQRWEEAR